MQAGSGSASTSVARRIRAESSSDGYVALLLFDHERKATGAAAGFDRATSGGLSRLLESGDFAGRWLETALLYPARGAKPARVLVVGLGKRAELTPPRLLQAAAVASRR